MWADERNQMILSEPTAGVTFNNTFTTFPGMPAGESATTNEPFGIKIADDAECGTELIVDLEFDAGKVSARDSIRVPIGLINLFFDSFDEDTGWVTNWDGTDTAELGTWERGNPEGVDAGSTVTFLHCI